MPSRKLTPAEAATADAILDRVKADIKAAAGNDPVLLFALRRRTFSRLMHWERGTPAERRKLQKLKYAEQNGRCGRCGEQMDVQGSELDRKDPVDGYTVQNTRLLHHDCHVKEQQEKGFS